MSKKSKNTKNEAQIVNEPINVEKTDAPESKSETNTDIEKVGKSMAKTKDLYEKKSKELTEKKYLVDGGEETLKALFEFIEKDVNWTAQECIGVVTLHDRLKAAEKMDKPMLDGDAIEAIGYFVGRITGTGLESAKKLKDGNIFDPISKMLTRVTQDKKELETIQTEWQELSNKYYELNQNKQKSEKPDK